MEPAAPRESIADNLLSELLPEELEWRRLVKTYPKTALVMAAVGGFYLGRTRGREIVDALLGFASDSVNDGVNRFLGDKVL